MSLAAQLSAWAHGRPGWAPADQGCLSGELSGTRVTLRVTPIDEDTAELSLRSDENCLRLSVTLGTTPFAFALDEELSRLAEATNESLERAATRCDAREQPPLALALSALCAAASRAPALVASLRSSSAAFDDGDDDSDSDEPGSPTAGWYSGDLSTRVRAASVA